MAQLVQNIDLLKSLFQKNALKCLIVIVVFALHFANAQFSVVGTYKVGLGANYLSFEVPNAPESMWQNQTTLNGSIGMNLDFAYELNDLTLKLIMEPNATLDSSGNGSLDAGLREVYASYRFDDIDFSIGLERLPLEAARLSVPFSITNALDVSDPNELKGFFDGIWSARATLYLDDNQLRLATFYREEQERIGAVLSLKRFFDDFDAQAIIVYDDYFAFGLNGSTLLADIVWYGESWYLLDAPTVQQDSTESSLRALLGATGYLDDGLWTIEAGYMPSQFSPTSIPQLLAQYQLPQDAVTWTINSGIGYVDSDTINGIAGLLSVNSTLLEDDNTASATLSTIFTQNNFTISISFNLEQAFDIFY